MKDEILFIVTERIKSSLEKHSDTTLIDRVRQTESGDVIEYKYISQIFNERKKHGKFFIFWEGV